MNSGIISLPAISCRLSAKKANEGNIITVVSFEAYRNAPYEGAQQNGVVESVGLTAIAETAGYRYLFSFSRCYACVGRTSAFAPLAIVSITRADSSW